MSTIDLNKLVVRKKFSIPVKSSALHKLILKQLKLDKISWRSKAKHPRSGIFLRDLRVEWAAISVVDEGLPVTSEIIEKRKADYDKNMFEHRTQALKRIVDSSPFEVHYVVTEEIMDRCFCDVTCFPTLYLKAGVYEGFKPKCDDSNIQVAKHRCEQFLVDIFVGGLKGREIIERREVSRWELLINDVDCRDVTDRINQLLQQATGEVLLMGWVGTDCLPRLKELKSQGLTIQAVTHKPSEMKAPVPKDIQQGYANLIKLLGKANVSTNRELHGRALIVDNKALIGSMDLNSFSLSGEHREFAIYTEDIYTVRKIRVYFKKIFVPLKKE